MAKLDGSLSSRKLVAQEQPRKHYAQNPRSKMRPHQIRKEAANLSQIIRGQQSVLKHQEMRDLERLAEALNSREGTLLNLVSGSDLHMTGPSKNDNYIR